MKTLKGKIALVTGGSRGLGKEMALRLAEKGAKLVITYHSNTNAAEQALEEIRAQGSEGLALQLDTGLVNTLDTFLSDLKSAINENWDAGGIDILVNNAGIIPQAPIAQMDEETFDRLTNIQYKGVFFLTQKILNLLHEGGRVINISTGLTRFSLMDHAAYAAAKSAVETFTRYLAKELGPRGITANVVAPGAINTDVNREAFSNPQVSGFISSVTALGRVGESEDIGGVVAFLATDEARWITGQRIEVSGGMFL